MYVGLNCLKNLFLSLVSGVPPLLFLGLHPWYVWPNGVVVSALDSQSPVQVPAF